MRFAVLFFVLPLLLSCGGRKSIPDNILSKEKMEMILWDLMRADQFNQDYIFSIDTAANRKEISIGRYRQVLALHKVDQATFRESYYYYRARPQLLKTVMDSISKREAFRQMPQLPNLSTDTVRTE